MQALSVKGKREGGEVLGINKRLLGRTTRVRPSRAPPEPLSSIPHIEKDAKYSCPVGSCMDPTAYCSAFDCVSSEWSYDSVCCKPVNGTSDCCASCDSSDSCPMLVYGGGSTCHVWMDESGSFLSKEWKAARCRGAKDGESDCYGEDGFCCQGNPDQIIDDDDQEEESNTATPTSSPTTPSPTTEPTNESDDSSLDPSGYADKRTSVNTLAVLGVAAGMLILG